MDGYEATSRWAPPGQVICAARSTCLSDGHSACPGIGDRASWAFGYNLNQGQYLADFNGVMLIYDPGRGCKDAYGRFFHEKQDCRTLYTHPTDPNAIWTYTGIAPAAECPTPGPTPTDPPNGHVCNLPTGTGDGVNCPRTSSRLLAGVTSALNTTVISHPDWLESPGVIAAGRENDFRNDIVLNLRRASFCAFFDGEEIALKNVNSFSEQYAVLSSDRRIRTGENSYRATCSPAWSAIPSGLLGGKRPPLESQQNVGDHCQNALNGNRFLLRHECDIDSTGIFRDPSAPDDNHHDQPCDPDHEPAWSTWCYQDLWLDPRGPIRTVTGANSWFVSGDNPNVTTVVFEPGREFKVCTRPQDQSWPTPVIRPAEQCHTMKYE